MSKTILEQFDQLMSHLNGEENSMAEEFRKALESLQEKSDRDALWRQCLESGGVDNWSWFSESLSDYWDTYDY